MTEKKQPSRREYQAAFAETLAEINLLRGQLDYARKCAERGSRKQSPPEVVVPKIFRALSTVSDALDAIEQRLKELR